MQINKQNRPHSISEFFNILDGDEATKVVDEDTVAYTNTQTRTNTSTTGNRLSSSLNSGSKVSKMGWRAYLNFIAIALSGFFGLIFCAKIDVWHRDALCIGHVSHEVLLQDLELVESMAYILISCLLVTSACVAFHKKNTGRISLTIFSLFFCLIAYSELGEVAQFSEALHSNSGLIPIPTPGTMIILYILYIIIAFIYQYKYIKTFIKPNSTIIAITFLEVLIFIGLTFFYFHAG